MVMYKGLQLLKNEKSLTGNQRRLIEYYIEKFSPYAGDDVLVEEYSKYSQKPAEISIYSVYTGNYDRYNARTYAVNYYNYYNTPTYPDLNGIGGDCANFVSQCLHAGSIAMDVSGGWYISPKVSNPDWDIDSVSELDANWNLADPSPWISASEFNDYWSSEAYDYESYTPSDLLNSLSSVYANAYTGDVIQITRRNLWWYEGYHTMIITGYNYPDLLMTYHTGDTLNRSLSAIVNAYNSSTYKFDIMYIKNGY